MSILKSLFDKIFVSAPQSPTPTISVAAPPPNTDTAPQSPVPPTSAGGSAPVPPPIVEVAPILDKAAAAKAQKLNWRTSIVDLMKALDVDSSLPSRQKLAQELHYSGDLNNSAKMNVWLHSQVLKKLAENGGKLPEELQA